MSLSAIIKSGLGILLDNPIIVEGAQKKALDIIKTHFTYSSEEIYQAYQDSYSYSITAITAGLAASDKKLLSLVKKVLYSKVTREFAEPIERNYFLAFAKNRGVPVNENSALRQQLIDELQKIANVTFFKVETEVDLSILINYQGSVAITELILEKISPLDDTLADFLRYDELLGKAILFFFRELMRKDGRLYKTQAALQRENLFLEVKNLQASVDSAKTNLSLALENNSDNLVEIAQELKYLRNAQDTWDARSQVLIDFPAWQNLLSQKIENLLDGVGKIHGKLDDVHDDVKITKSAVEEIRELLSELLQRQNLSTQLKPRDEFTQHNSESLNLIQKAVSQFKQLPKNDANYSQVSMMLGSALSSTGDLEKSEALFQKIVEDSSIIAEKALAHFNLFQVQLRSNNYAAAVKNLQEAIELNPKSYTLHDNDKYPLESLLGAGGMGCVFRCKNLNRLIKQEKVVVKCFWENLSGSIDEVFNEPFAMRDIAGDYIPEPLDFGYVDYFAKNRAYFVSQYIDGAIDGEVWLKQNGKMDLKTALEVGLKIAKGLVMAHQNGIYHLDLKPANILLKQTNTGIMVKIIDFGLSQVAPSLESEISTQPKSLTVFGQAVFGTYDYAPPEQQGMRQYGVPSATSDVFAFGATLYRFLTGLNPRRFSERKLPEIRALRVLLFDCVEENPLERPSSVEVLRQLEEIADSQDAGKKRDAKIAARKKAEEKQRIEAKRAAKRQAKQKRQAKLEAKIKAKPELKKDKIFEFDVVTVTGIEKHWFGKNKIITSSTRKTASYNTENLPNGVTLDMVSIPGGAITMGEHKFTISPFYMAKYLTTQAQWKAVMGNNPSDFKGDNRPVDSVSWNDAVKFCKKLSEMTGKNYRLATEAEWKYACRAGTNTPFYFGETITTDLVNYDGNYPYGDAPKGVYRKKTTDVGSFPPNAFGLYDMHGNLWEWCCSEYHSKYQGDENTSKNQASLFVLRGGSWGGSAWGARTAFRNRDDPTGRYRNFGVRLSRTP